MSREHESERADKVRLAPDSFSDIIFGLALSIGSLILIQNQVTIWQNFVWNIVLFGLSFAIIGMTWLSFSTTIRYLSTEDPTVVFLNLALFFCVVLEPYLFYMLMNAGGLLLDVVSDAFALNIGFMFFVLGALASIAVKNAGVSTFGNSSYRSEEEVYALKQMIFPRYVLSALCLFSMAPFFWILTPLGHLRFLSWTSAFAVFLVYHITLVHSHKQKSGGREKQ